MITITCQRNHAAHALTTIFNYIALLQLSQLKNVNGMDKTNGEYLTVRLINCLLSEVEILFKRKLITTSGDKINIKMSHAQGIAFYRALLTMPVGAENFYLNFIRNQWIEIIDQQILKL